MLSLFGIAIYNVRVLNKPIEPCKNNAIFQEVAIDARREQFCFENLEELLRNFQNSFNVVPLNGLQVMLPKNMKDTSLHYKCMYAVNYKLFQKNLNCIDEPNSVVVELLKNQLENILRAAALTLRGLKRLVKEHKEYLNQGSELNPKGSNKKSLFLYYILFTLGKSDGSIQNLQDLTTYIKQRFSVESIDISDELSRHLYEEVLSTKGYFEIIKKGAVAVETWNFD